MGITNRYLGTVVLAIFFGLTAGGFILYGCGGDNGGSSPAPPPSTSITGTVSGTVVVAINENGEVAGTYDTAGKTPVGAPPRYPFSISVPPNHQYHLYLIVDEGTSTERNVPLYFPTLTGSTNVVSIADNVSSLDLGYVDTSGAQATAENNPLVVSGVTPGPETGSPTIRLEGYKEILLWNDSNGVKRYRTQIEVKDAAGNVLTNRSLVKGMKVYSPTGAELLPDVNYHPPESPLPPDGNFFLWNGEARYLDNSVTLVEPFPDPMTSLMMFFTASPGTLETGFYTVAVTDNNGNLFTTKAYFETPSEVVKPTGLSQTINVDNSITLTWTNPPEILVADYPKYLMVVYVFAPDGNGDRLTDQILLIHRSLPRETYTISADFMNAHLAGKAGLQWEVEIRQRTPTEIPFPDGTSPRPVFYRNRSVYVPLSLP